MENGRIGRIIAIQTWPHSWSADRVEVHGLDLPRRFPVDLQLLPEGIRLRLEVAYSDSQRQFRVAGLHLTPMRGELDDEPNYVPDEWIKSLNRAARLPDDLVQLAQNAVLGYGPLGKDVRTSAGGPVEEQARMDFAEDTRRRKRRRRMTPEHLQEVADIYNAHSAEGGRKPTKAVADHFNIGPAQASRYVQSARAENPPLIPPLTERE